MPIYEYVCRECGAPVEKLQKMSDPPLTDCPACGEAALKRKVSAAAFRLAGSGWYETDFKKDNRHNLASTGDKKGGSSSGSDKSSGSSSDSGKSDSGSKSKPETKTGTGKSPESVA